MHWVGPYFIKGITDGGAIQLVKLNGDPFPEKVNGSRLKPYTTDSSILICDSSIVLALQATARRHGTISYTSRVV